MSRLGFFGGSFNPITIAHVDLILKAIEDYSLDKVYFVPMNDKYQKQDLIPLNKRKEMIKLAINNNSKLDIFFLDNDKETKAIDSFEKIDEEFIDDERFFIMGSDNYKKIADWKDYEKLKKYNFIVLDRDSEKSYKTNNISSTKVRESIKTNLDIKEYVSEDVEKYIKENKLYF